MKKDLLRGLYLFSWTTASILAADKITFLRSWKKRTPETADIQDGHIVLDAGLRK